MNAAPWWIKSRTAEYLFILFALISAVTSAFLSLHSFTVSEEPVHGVGQQAAPPSGGLLHTLVSLLLPPEPPPGLLPAGGLQQHHPVSV